MILSARCLTVVKLPWLNPPRKVGVHDGNLSVNCESGTAACECRSRPVADGGEAVLNELLGYHRFTKLSIFQMGRRPSGVALSSEARRSRKRFPFDWKTAW